MLLSRREVRSIADRLLAGSKSDGCEIVLRGGREHNLRFANGGATTNRTAEWLTLRVSAHAQERVGLVEIASVDEAAGLRALAKAEEIARALPQDPDYVPPLGPQRYARSNLFCENTAALGLDALASFAGSAIAQSRASEVAAFGQVASGASFFARATSAGLFSYERQSAIELSTTARNRNDAWSGWAGAKTIQAAGLNAAALARHACDKAAWSQEPRDLDPGSWTVVFEPEATAELASWLLHALDARSADEGRSFFSRKGGGNLRGEGLFDEKLTLRSDPNDLIAPQKAIGFEGAPQRPRAWIENGRLVSLFLDRAYAKKRGEAPIPSASSFRMEGGSTPIEEMIRATKRGLLVTRLWYTNMLDPRSLLLTGLTRDGNFLIEDGRIVAPARNLRFNQSLAALFAKIEALGPAEPTWRSLRDEGFGAAPAMLVSGVTFSSRSGGI
ncbi:TldD/PmbA family protein [Methylocystis bryophila]|uniref:Peptidase U62 n=1 Tax=Methylocystis bryophila TaxID=655015 RepID=A0A1W6N197_9HYPH|nr:metallopeptidase TldD-related protein [Methylocystis bryophila]ARN83577.1 peptidase U62 [Methylocystis bryophila]BDV37540.1 TldD protein [Methylocystis bryophila]